MKQIWLYAATLFLTGGCATIQPTAQAPAESRAPAKPTGSLVASFEAANTSGKLYSGPCVDELVVPRVPPQLRPEMKSASGTYEGKVYAVCWLWNVDESAAVMVWEDGGYFAVPKPMLKFPLGV